MTDTQLAVDISNYQNGIYQAQFERMKAEGIRTVICGTDGNATKPLVFPAQARNAKAAGLNVEAYIYLYLGSGGAPFNVAGRTADKLQLIDDAGDIKRVWLDCEDETSGLAPGQIVDLISAAKAEVEKRGYECGIYTAAWWWVPYTHDNAMFTDLKLWAAQYDGQADIDVFTPFGGWAEAFRKQYTDKGTAGGITPIDMNVERVEVAPAVDDFQRGRSEMYEAWVRETEAHLEHVKSLRAAWGVQ